MNSYKKVDKHGTVRWYRVSTKILHREDGPAVEWSDGGKEWYRNGKRHREDGPAIERANNDKFWYHNGKFHREDGPAIESINGIKFWYRNNQIHRLDGPAAEYANGKKDWFYEDKYIKCSTQEEFERLIKLKAFW